MPSRRDINLAWAAGFFDGEGSTSFVTIGRGARLLMSISQVDRRNLFRFRAAIEGIGNICAPRSLPNRQPISAWSAYNRDAMRALGMLSEYLGPAKREQSVNAVHRYMFRLVPPPGPCRRGHVNPPIYQGQCGLCRAQRRAGVQLPPIVRRPAIEFVMHEHEYVPAPLSIAQGAP